MRADQVDLLGHQTPMRDGAHLFEWEHRRLDGQAFPADVLLTRMELGQEIFLQATVRDITERKRIEEHLAASEEKYRTVVNNLKEVVFRTADADQLLGTAGGMAIRFDQDEARPMGRATYGVRGITVDDADHVLAPARPLPIADRR